MKTTSRNRRGLQPKPSRSSRGAAVSTAQANGRSRLAVQSILVPVDFSECSKKALLYARAFANQFGGELTVLHVVKPYIPVPEATMVDVGLIERNLRKTAEYQMAELQKEMGGSKPFRPLVRAGNPAIEVVKAARNLGADLIIISTHGRTGVGHWLMGSTAEKVVRSAHCPVLVVREQEREFLSAPRRGNGAAARKKT